MLLEMLDLRQYPSVKKVTKKSLPKIGYIALLNNQPIAVGFLRRVECDEMAQIDGLTSNPMFGSLLRHEGLRQVVDRIIQDAKDLKLQGLYAFTEDQGVLKRAMNLGFKSHSHNLISLSLDI